MDELGEFTFEQWQKRVDRHVSRMTGLSMHDFPDWRWRDAYEDGTRPGQAADEFLEEMAEEDPLLADLLGML